MLLNVLPNQSVSRDWLHAQALILQLSVYVSLSDRTLQPFYHEMSSTPIAWPWVGLVPYFVQQNVAEVAIISLSLKGSVCLCSLLFFFSSLCDQAQATFWEDEVPYGEKLKFLH